MNKLFKNEYLFSEIYLEQITNFEEKHEILSSLKTLKEYQEYADTDSLTEWKSSFIQKVFGVLGFSYSPLSENLIQLFVQGKTDKAISLCYSLLPSENLDNTTIGKHWSEKIIKNLKQNNLQWGLLTNGNKWRIYHLDEPTPYECYLEIDLEKILTEEEAKNYMVFFEFMKADNFILNENGKCKFDEFKKESYELIEYIEDELKSALKQQEGEGGKGVLNDLCLGYVDFFRSKKMNDFREQKFRDQIYSGAMLYMFRLLFVFYASARNLLTEKEISSFRNILNKCVSLYHSKKGSKQSYVLWEELREVFGVIDIHYNGGLFDPQENKFVDTNKISDHFLSRVLYHLNFYEDKGNNEKLISYRDMGVRHLGTLYEGLLEHKLFIAEENTQVKIEKGVVKFIPESEGGVIVEGAYIPKGEVYFAGDKGERKSTGSYYTPEYIVDYIVNNTVCEKLKELKEEFVKETFELLEDINAAPDEYERKVLKGDFNDKLLNFVKNKILKLSVLDPAMGSGHFLVNSTNKISNFITEFLNDYNFIFENSSSTTYWRRRVVENCIYGVDINPLAVELAKLSLWILSMAKDAHLSFLNHHLKCGNSLIGARLSDIGIYPGNKKKMKKGELSLWDKDENFKQTVEKVINDYFAIEERETFDKDDIEYKKELLDDINEDLAPYKKVCDLHTDIYFDETIDESYYFTKLKSPQSIVVENNSYFHWDLEFPEVFRDFSGFDIIIGNPPYIRHEKIEYSIKQYLSEYYTEFSNSSADMYVYFIGKSVLCSREFGKIMLITLNKWMKTQYGAQLREFLSEDKVDFIVDFFELPVFEAATDTAIIKCDTTNTNMNSLYFPISDLTEFKTVFLKSITPKQIIMDNADWTFGNVGDISMLDKISEGTISLKEFVDGRIYRGITTGLNDAFVLDKETKDFLVESESSEIVKDYAKSTDIDHWEIHHNNKGFLATGYDIDLRSMYPTALKHLDKFKTKLQKRYDKGKNYFNLRACNYYKEFEKNKIIYMHTAKKHKFYIDTDGRYINNSCYMIITNSKYLFFFLNSPLFTWFKKTKFVAYGDANTSGRVKLDYNKMILVPIKPIEQAVNNRFEELFEACQIAHQSNDITRLNNQVKRANLLIYRIYNLTDLEVLAIDNLNTKELDD